MVLNIGNKTLSASKVFGLYLKALLTANQKALAFYPGGSMAVNQTNLRHHMMENSSTNQPASMTHLDDYGLEGGAGVSGMDYQDAEYNRFLSQQEGGDDTSNVILMAQRFLPALRQMCGQRDYFAVSPSSTGSSASFAGTTSSSNETEDGLGAMLAAICDLFDNNADTRVEERADWFSSSIALLNVVYVPLIIILGLVGNSLSFMVYLQTRLKVRSSSQYLAALAATDSLFLINLMCTWIDEDLMSYTASCRALNYMTHVAAFLSAWYVVAFTVERFIAIQFPFHKKHVCSVKRAQYVVVGLLLFGLLFNLPALTSDVVKGQCVPPSSLASAWRILSVVDMCITHAIPTLGLLVMNTLISRELFRFSAKYRHHPPSPTVLMTGTQSHVRNSDAPVVDQQQPLQGHILTTRRGQVMVVASHSNLSGQHSQLAHQPGQQQLMTTGSRLGNGVEGGVRGPDSVSSSATERPPPSASASAINERSRTFLAGRLGLGGSKVLVASSSAQPTASIIQGTETDRNILSRGTQRRITKTLLIVSTVTIVLNLPSHVMRLITAFGDSGKEAEPKLANFQQLAMLLYYTNFSINFILYAMCGKNFRKCLIEYIKRLLFQCKPRTRNINDSFEMR